MIEVKKIEPFTCEAFGPGDVSLGHLNDFEFNDLRIQIKNTVDAGNKYYMMYEDEQIFIDKDGRCKSWPRGFYDQWEKQLMQLL